MHMRRKARRARGIEKAHVVVAVRGLRSATRIDAIDLRGDLVGRAQPGLAHRGQRGVAVIGGKHVGGTQSEPFQRGPDAVVGAGLGEVVTTLPGRAGLGN